jgi:hypothetical protein
MSDLRRRRESQWPAGERELSRPVLLTALVTPAYGAPLDARAYDIGMTARRDALFHTTSSMLRSA